MKMTDKEVVRYIIKRLRKDSEREHFVLSNHIFRYIRDYIDNVRDGRFLSAAYIEADKGGYDIDANTLLRYYDVTRPEEINMEELNNLYKRCKVMLIKDNLITKEK